MNRVFQTLFLLAVTSVALWAADPPAEKDSRELYSVDLKSIQKLISTLTTGTADEQEEAERRLMEIGAAATGELTKAAGSGKESLARSATRILEAIPKANHWVLDAGGKPLPRAAMEFFRLERADDDGLPKASYAKVTSDDEGGFAFPALPKGAPVVARVVQPDYGIALMRLSQFEVEMAARGTTRTSRIRVPLVTGDSDYGRRAVTGKVVDEEGKPVFGAQIRCTSVRTPGDGLINPLYPLHDAVTAKDGSFRYYLPNREPGEGERGEGDPLAPGAPTAKPEQPQRGKLIPENSKYNLEIRTPLDGAFFPAEQYVANAKPATIRLKRGTLKHRFEFEATEGGVIEDTERLTWITLTYRQPFEGIPGGAEYRDIKLDRKMVAAGGLLVAGEYRATYHDGRGRAIEWLPVSVDKSSPEKLRFKIPPPVVYTGRVVDGITGKPVAGAFVGGWNSTSHNNMALITPEQWTAMEKLPAKAAIGDPAFKPLLTLYGFLAIVRTDDEGRFKLTQSPEHKFYGVMAFARHRLPLTMGNFGFREQLAKGPNVNTGEVPLFPAARLRVHPVFDPMLARGRNLGVWPRWQTLKDGQPDWFSKFAGATSSFEQREFGQLNWLKLNEAEPMLVPAGVRFRMEFACPYDDKWVPTNRDEVFELREGAEADFGELKFDPAAEVKVRVVGPDGTPVEGVPVRRFVQQGGTTHERAWSIPHNSDAAGTASFYVPSKAIGQFGVFVTPDQQIKVLIDFRATDYSSDKPFRIELSKEQIATLRGGGKKP